MTNILDDPKIVQLVNDSCHQTTKQLLELAQTFATKSRRPPTKLTLDDLINAFECMNILYKKQLLRNEEHFLGNLPKPMFDIEYK